MRTAWLTRVVLRIPSRRQRRSEVTAEQGAMAIRPLFFEPADEDHILHDGQIGKPSETAEKIRHDKETLIAVGEVEEPGSCISQALDHP